MSWVQAAPLVPAVGKEGEVFDEEADESLLVQREWQSHMRRRVKVKLRGGRGAGWSLGVPGCGERSGVVRRFRRRLRPERSPPARAAYL